MPSIPHNRCIMVATPPSIPEVATPVECVHEMLNYAHAAVQLGWLPQISEKMTSTLKKFEPLLPADHPRRDDIITAHTSVATLTSYMSTRGSSDPDFLLRMLDMRVRKLSTMVQ
jgi:hypothetical protein